MSNRICFVSNLYGSKTQIIMEKTVKITRFLKCQLIVGQKCQIISGKKCQINMGQKMSNHRGSN